MFKNIITFIQENSTLTISLISLALSLYNFFYSIYIRHTKIKINLVTYNFYKDNNSYINTFCIDICNCSQLPISITQISTNNIFCTHNQKYFKREAHTQKDKILAEKNTFTFQFPINLGILQSTSGYVEFISKEKINLDNLNFEVYTNRRGPKKVKPSKLNLINDKDTNF